MWRQGSRGRKGTGLVVRSEKERIYGGMVAEVGR
jgi:hypothetical protein